LFGEAGRLANLQKHEDQEDGADGAGDCGHECQDLYVHGYLLASIMGLSELAVDWGKIVEIPTACQKEP
jgi:hypothetical protein